MYESYGDLIKREKGRKMSLSTYSRELSKMKISFAKLGHEHEQCEQCIMYELHSCEGLDGKLNSCKCWNKKCICCREFSWAIKKKTDKTCGERECCTSHKSVTSEIEAAKKDCAGCNKFTIHIEKKNLARYTYEGDRNKAENSNSDSNAIYLSLDLQKVKIIPEIEGVKAAVFTQRIAVYNESFSPMGRKSPVPSLGIKEWGEMMRT